MKPAVQSFILAFVFFTLSTNVARGQEIYSVNANAIFMVGSLKEYYSSGFGVSAQYEYPLNEKIIGLIRAGFIYVPNDFDLGILIFSIPLQGGVKYMLNDTFYAQGMLGANVVNAVATFGSGSGTYFSMGAGVGAHLGKFDIAPHIDYVDNGWSHFGIRIGYRIER